MGNPPGRVLVIAGSDSGGGAGIQADIKTITCLGGYATTAITALTAQNTQGVAAIEDVPDAFIAKQIAMVLEDIGADSIKTGMLHTASVIKTVAKTLCSPLGGEQACASVSTAQAVGGNPKIRDRAKALRKNLTKAEKKLWQHISHKQLDGFKFRRQQPIGGKYIADFICLEAKLIIELDGGQHSGQQDYDRIRDNFLTSEDYRVIRIWNNEVFNNIEGVLTHLRTALSTPHTSSFAKCSLSATPPQGGSNISIPLILDPVMFAKGGAALLQPDALDCLKDTLIPLATMVTPNIPEAEFLSGVKIHSVDDMQKAAEKILKLGCKYVLLKGGHLQGDTLTDLLVSADGQERYTSQRIDTPHTHGTGCTLASALATGFSQKLSLHDNVRRARDYVHQAIAHAPGLGNGHGPLGHNFMICAEEKKRAQ